MVRKQFNLHRQQAITLKQPSKSLGLSEAESIRQAGYAVAPFLPDVDAWEEALAFMLALQALGAVSQAPRSWRRDDLYEDH
jgi:hypothetical protein